MRVTFLVDEAHVHRLLRGARAIARAAGLREFEISLLVGVEVRVDGIIGKRPS